MPRLFLVALVLGGCAASHTKPPPAAAPPPASLVEHVLPGSGLHLEARGSYEFEQQLQRYFSRPGSDLAAFFGTDDEYFVRAELTDLHLRVLDLLEKRLRGAPKMDGFRFGFDVRAVDFFTAHDPQSRETRPTCLVQVHASLHRESGGEALAGSVMEKRAKELPGGRQTLDALCQGLADQLTERLETWRGQMPWGLSDKSRPPP